jgi:AraC-like DNA-binding protein/mannose-6-phosphate isomerase-like protein (cupin superfamily)
VCPCVPGSFELYFPEFPFDNLKYHNDNAETMDKQLIPIITRLQGALPVVRSMGNCIFDPIWAQKTHASRDSEMHFVIRGRVCVHTAKWSYTAKAGDLIYIPCKVPHRDEFDLKTGLEVFMIHFKWEMEPEYLKLVSPRALGGLSASARTEIARLFDRLRTKSGKSSDTDRLIAQSYVLTILLIVLSDLCRSQDDFQRTKHGKAGAQHRQWIMQEARQYLERHYAEPILLDNIAEAIGVSPFYLSHVFSEESDFSLFSYLTELRMSKAKSLLAEGRLNVKETARAVGYQDSSYFSKVFRKHFGVAPKKLQGS